MSDDRLVQPPALRDVPSTAGAHAGEELIPIVSLDLPTERARALVRELERIFALGSSDVKGVHCVRIPQLVSLHATLVAQLATEPEGDAA